MDGKRIHAAILGVIAAGCLIATLLLTVPVNAAAMDTETVTTGAVYRMSISACSDKKSAIAVLDAETVSHAHANKLFDALDDCGSAALTFRVGAVVHQIRTQNGDIYRAVEISDPKDGTMVAYWLTSMQIAPPKKKASDEIQMPRKSKSETS